MWLVLTYRVMWIFKGRLVLGLIVGFFTSPPISASLVFSTINTNKAILCSLAWIYNLTFIPSVSALVDSGDHKCRCNPGNVNDRLWELQRCRKYEICAIKAIKSLQYAAYVCTHFQKPMLLFSLCLQWQWRWNSGPQKAIWHLIEQSYYFSLPLECDFHCFMVDGWKQL